MLAVRGFTLVEALVAVAISFFIVIGIAIMIGFFPTHIKNRILLSCAVEGANSGINACKAGEAINSIQCGGYEVNISITGICSPPKGSCSEVTATATVEGKSFSLKDMVCNL